MTEEGGAAAAPPQSLILWTYDRLVDLMAAVCGLMIMFTMATVTVDVLLRAVSNYSLWWSFEVTEFLLVYMPLLTLPWLARRRGHIVIDIVVSRLSKVATRRLDFIVSILAAMICACVAYWGFLATASAFQRGIVTSGMISYPRWALLGAIPIGFGLAAIEYARLARGNWQMKS